MRPRSRQHATPRFHPFEIGGEVASGEERAHRLADDPFVLGARPAGERHGLVEHGHAHGHPSGLHVGQATIGQCLHLEVDVTEPPCPIEGQVGPLDQHRRVVHVTAHGGECCVALRNARRLVLHQPHGPEEPRSGCDPVAQHVGVHVAQAGAGHGRLTPVPFRRQPDDRGREMGHRTVDVPGGQRVVSPSENVRVHRSGVLVGVLAAAGEAPLFDLVEGGRRAGRVPGFGNDVHALHRCQFDLVAPAVLTGLRLVLHGERTYTCP